MNEKGMNYLKWKMKETYGPAAVISEDGREIVVPVEQLRRKILSELTFYLWLGSFIGSLFFILGVIGVAASIPGYASGIVFGVVIAALGAFTLRLTYRMLRHIQDLSNGRINLRFIWKNYRKSGNWDSDLKGGE